MNNLLQAEFYKLRKSKAGLIGLLTVAFLALLLYASLVMIDKISQGEMANGSAGIMVYQNGNSLEENGDESIREQVGVTGVLRQMFGGHFVGIILAVLVSIFVIQEFSNGTIKNLVGKGYARTKIFLAKMLAAIVLTLIFETIALLVTVCLGVPFMGGEIYAATVWSDVAVYAALQLLFGVAIAVIFLLVGELTRNLAAGIAVSIGVLMFSTTLTAGLDLIFHGWKGKPSDYWILDLMSGCPVTDFSSEFIMRSVLVSVVWLLLAAVLGALHFQKADVK
ncbi:hypothetical protein D3Z36_16895 [Lachnospiraceae bacterium]|nr:hypothetical protein [Lachnospiraceae bacterium]